LPLLLLGCVSGGNTPAQDLAWERWNECSAKFRSFRLEGGGISPDGQISFYPHHPVMELCLEKAAQVQAQRPGTPR